MKDKEVEKKNCNGEQLQHFDMVVGKFNFSCKFCQ